MEELANLMRLFGTIDQVAVAVPAVRPTVAALIPAYDEGAAGWFDAVGAWAAQPAPLGDEEAVGELPSVADALAALSEGPYGRALATRRLLAVAILGRLPTAAIARTAAIELRAVSERSLVGVLRPVAKAGDSTLDPDAKATRLFDLLTNADDYPGIDSWPALMRAALGEGVLDPLVANQVMTALAWRVVPPIGRGGPAVAFETRLLVEDVPINEVERVLDQMQWVNLRPPWCAMRDLTPLGAGTSGVVPGGGRCLEVIAVDCDVDPPPFLRLRTVLDFRTRPLPPPSRSVASPGRVLEYRLHPDQRSFGGDGRVTVDEGSLVVRQHNDVVEVVTTKRVQFAVLSRMSPLLAAQLACFVWVLGYSHLTEYFLVAVLEIDPAKVHVLRSHGTRRIPAGTGPPGTVPPGTVPPGTVPPGTVPPGTVPPGRSAAGGAATPVGQAVVALEAAWDECVGEVRTSVRALAAGGFAPADVVTSATQLSSRLVRHGTLLMKLMAEVVPSTVHGSAPR